MPKSYYYLLEYFEILDAEPNTKQAHLSAHRAIRKQKKTDTVFDSAIATKPYEGGKKNSIF